jgi:hypothetical protein
VEVAPELRESLEFAGLNRRKQSHPCCKHCTLHTGMTTWLPVHRGSKGLHGFRQLPNPRPTTSGSLTVPGMSITAEGHHLTLVTWPRGHLLEAFLAAPCMVDHHMVWTAGTPGPPGPWPRGRNHPRGMKA